MKKAQVIILTVFIHQDLTNDKYVING